MKKNKKNIPIIILSGFFLILSFFFFSFKTVKAETVTFSQLVNATTTNNTSFPFQTLGTTSVAGQTINSATIFIDNTGNNNFYATINLNACPTGATYTGIQTCSFGSNFGAGGEINFLVATNTAQYYTGYFSATTTVTNREYAIAPNFVGNNAYIGGSINANVYTQGEYRAGGEEIKDIYFKVGNNLENITENYITITIPRNGEVFPILENFGIKYNYSTTTIQGTGIPENEVLIQMRWASTTTAFDNGLAYHNGFTVFTNLNASTTISTYGTLPLGDYYARGYILGTNGNNFYTIATSTTIQFTTTENDTFGGPPMIVETFGVATTTGNLFNQCEQLNVEGWQLGVCNTFAFLFQPHAQSINDLETTFKGFQNIFPFSVAFGIKQNTSTIFNNGTTTSPFALTIQYGNININPTLLTGTILEDNNLTAFKNLYFTIAEYLIWIGLGYLIYRKIMRTQ